jgi:hypothetical protein
MRDNQRVSFSVSTTPIGMLRFCEWPGCRTLTIGGTCVAHDPIEVVGREHPFGRPFERIAAVVAARETVEAA